MKMKSKLLVATVSLTMILSQLSFADQREFRFLNVDGDVHLTLDAYEDVNSFHSGLARVKSGGLYGYINTDGDIVIDFKYVSASDFKEGYAYVQLEDGTTEIIDTLGEVYNDPCELASWASVGVIPIEDSKIEDSVKAQVTVSGDNDKMILRAEKDNLLVSLKYDGVYQFGNEVYMLVEDGLTGLFNASTFKLIEPQYKFFNPENQHGCIAYSDNEFVHGLIDQNGEVLIEVNKTDILSVHPNLKKTVKDHYFNFGAVSTNEPPNIQTSIGQISMEPCDNGLMLVRTEYIDGMDAVVKYTLYDPNFTMMICELDMSYVDVMHNALIGYSREDGTTSIFNLFGDVIASYDGCFEERNGDYFTIRRDEDELFLVSRDGAYLEESHFDESSSDKKGYDVITLPVNDDCVVVGSERGYDIVNLDGQVKTKQRYTYILPLNNGVAVAEYLGDRMYVNTDGHVLYDQESGEWIHQFSEGYGLVESVDGE